MPASVETELKLRAEDDGPLRQLAAADWLGPAALGPTADVAELDRYLDTIDGRLAAAGWALRLRSREGATRVSLKGPPQAGTSGAIHRRPELEGPADDLLDPRGWAPSAARELVAEIVGDAPLAERLALRQLRTERWVLLDDLRVATLSLDRVRVVHQGVDQGGFLVVELELDNEALDRGLDPAPIADSLQAIPGLAAEQQTKLERAHVLLGDIAP